MPTSPETLADAYRDQVWRLVGTLPGLDGLRERALTKFAKSGFPTSRDEAWRYSDLKALKDKVLLPAKMPGADIEVPEALCETSTRLVFVNGAYREDLSDQGDFWQAASVRPIANHLMANLERVDELVTAGDGVGFLNTALMRDGLVFSIPAGVEIDDPIEVLHIMTDAGDSAAHMRHLIELGEGAQATLVERFVGDEDGYWLNSVVQARVADNAHFNHFRLQEEGASAVHTAKSYVNIGAGGMYQATNVSLGSAVARFEAHVRLLMDGASASIDGVALAGSGQSHDMLVHADHRMPDTKSDQIFRTVADARGKTSFQGMVTVAEGAQKTTADQSFKALLLDRTAEANAKPELEIFADDVKCSHGATVGELDEKALFYLTSRGIDPATARQMLVEAFTDEALARLDNEDFAAAVRARIAGWMVDHAPSEGTE